MICKPIGIPSLSKPAGILIAGIPAMSVPAGFDSDGMPIGLQIMSPQLSESKLFNIAYKFEQANDYYKQLADI